MHCQTIVLLLPILQSLSIQYVEGEPRYLLSET